MFNKILFATDGSEHSHRTLQYVKELAQKFGSEVIVLHVIHFGYEWVSPTEAEKILLGARDAGQALVNKAAQELKAAGIKVKAVVDEGPTAPEILSEAEKEGCDLIALGSRGAGAVAGMLLGSVSTRVSTGAKVPVLIVH